MVKTGPIPMILSVSMLIAVSGCGTRQTPDLIPERRAGGVGREPFAAGTMLRI